MKLLLTLIGAGLLAMSPLHAATVNVSSITGTWDNVTGATAGGEGTNAIWWGSGSNLSSYVFDAAATPIMDPASPLYVGDFIHNNYPISPPSITGADLTVSIGGDVDGSAFSLSGVFSFLHDETPNSAPCDAGSVSVCDDRVTITGSAFTGDSLSVAGVDYVFNLSGFSGGVDFWTQENASNVASLYATFVETRTTAVPLPASALLLIAGLGAFIKRRKVT